MDFYLSLSHSLLSTKLEGVRPTGFQMDKNGNFKFVFNISVTMLVEKSKRGDWEEARSMFISITAKGKVTKNTSNKFGERLLKIAPKSIEMSDLKIYDAQDKENELEQMLITSGFNVQMEQLVKSIPPFEMPMKNLPSPQELDCIGFRPSDLDFNFKKGYVELTCGYQKVDKPRDEELCKGFLEAMTEGPKAAKENIDSLFGGQSAQEFIESKRQMYEQEYAKMQGGQDEEEEE